MATEISISSNASLRLGGPTISSFDESDVDGSNLDTTRLARNLWPTVRQAVLRKHSWNCATARVLLSPDAAAPPFGFAYRFLLPGDWLKTLQLGDSETCRFAWRSEGRYVLCNESALPLVYIYDNTNVQTWDAALVQAAEIAMALAMCYPITKSTSLKQDLEVEFERLIQQARTADAQDDPGDTLGESLLFASRFGSYGGVR
ncbi:hypothetical protein [Xanthomonas sacchari]|uniref:hypothetical protein n=1 Tax=Xanthomonas sacchari TaxID=56458 RepID=UPI002252D866|nr:hypothetical protein [Xanthomonas sacchari]MCW0370265.1 hypothetical protein [Xanthomonas sacchari]